MAHECDIRQVNKTKVFDFDNTLYRGESAVDFALFMIRSKRKIILWLPKIFWNLLKYKLCLVKQDDMEVQIDRFLQSCLPEPEDLRLLVRRFWKSHIRKLDSGIIGRIKPEDAIVTAGPAFLLLPVRKQLGTANLLCSEVDLTRKRVLYLNFSDHKVQRYRERFGQTPVEAFYTDSYNDRAMMQIAEKVYLVRKGNVRRIR